MRHSQVNYNKICSQKPEFGNIEQIIRIKVIDKIISDFPFDFSVFCDVFMPCHKMELFLLNFRDFNQLDRAYFNYVYKTDFYEEYELEYRKKIIEFKPSSLFIDEDYNPNQLKLF